MNPKAIKVSMTNEERTYVLPLLKKHRKEVIAAMNKEKSEAVRNTMLESITFDTKLINKINK